jgi:predicted ATP-binding protein involved in virulence
MKKLLLKEILLLSKKEGKAKKIRFDPDTTVVTGLNNTGKSSLIKSIYHCLGADVDYHPKWKGANVTCLLKFELDDKDYNILRHQNLFGVFDNKLNLIKAAQGTEMT